MCTRVTGAVLVLTAAAWPAGLTYSTYLSEGFTPAAIAADSGGNVYLAGATAANPGYPSAAPSPAIVVKVNPGGTSYVYYRSIGGSAQDSAAGIAVDGAGNAYVVGTATSPDFPVTAGQKVVGTLPASAGSRAFLVKLDPRGEVVFSETIGNVNTTGLAVALTAQGDIVVSGTSATPLTATAGAYSSSNGSGLFLMEFDPTGTNVIFTATGIGGNALEIDAAGNIYMAGSTAAGGYPTTPGAYQPGPGCTGQCGIFGPFQYITKVDPAAGSLIYSTFVGAGSSSINKGLVVDSSGNAYLTGLNYSGYQSIIGPPMPVTATPFLTKLDAAGASVLYSVSVGGAGVVFGSQSDLYVGGAWASLQTAGAGILPEPPLPPGVSAPPSACQTNNITTFSEGTVTHMDLATGNVLGTVLVDGSNVSLAGVAYAGGSNVWAAGSTQFADTPITPGALMPAFLGRGPDPGAYLGEANFGTGSATAPLIACIVDSANTARVGVAAPGQLISLMGTGLGPTTPVGATDYATTSLGGVTVTFNGVAAPLLYVSSTQINVAVPPGVLDEAGGGVDLPNYVPMQLTMNNAPAMAREIPLVASNPSVFGDLSGTVSSCTVGGIVYYGAFTDVALNADGNFNSCADRASPGSAISLFLNGLGVNDIGGVLLPWPASQIPIAVTIGGWSAQVTSVTAVNPFVWQVEATVPAALAQSPLWFVGVTVDLNLATGVVAAGPLTVQRTSFSDINPGNPYLMSMWVNP
jgi:uncharacterized protein (TIGR03437 family)